MSSARSIPKKLRNYVASSASPQISTWISAGFAKHADPTQRIESAPRAVASAAPQETTLATARRSDYTGGNRDDETELQNSQSICFRDDGCVSARPGNYHQCKRQRVQRRRQAYRDPLWREED